MLKADNERAEEMNKLSGLYAAYATAQLHNDGLRRNRRRSSCKPSTFSGSWFRIALGFGTGVRLYAAAMNINEYYDRDIDATNEPMRPIPTGAVKAQEALAMFLARSK